MLETKKTENRKQKSTYNSKQDREHKMIKYIRTGLAGILLLVLLTVSGLALAGPALQHPLNIATTAATIIAQAADTGAQPEAAISTGQQSANTQIVNTGAAQQPVAVLDARTAVAEVGPA